MRCKNAWCMSSRHFRLSCVSLMCNIFAPLASVVMPSSTNMILCFSAPEVLKDTSKLGIAARAPDGFCRDGIGFHFRRLLRERRHAKDGLQTDHLRPLCFLQKDGPDAVGGVGGTSVCVMASLLVTASVSALSRMRLATRPLWCAVAISAKSCR